MPARQRAAIKNIMREGLSKIVSDEETIVAISTPLGRSGLGVIRISGKDARVIVRRFFKTELQHRTATLGTWTGSDGRALDEVVVTAFFSPNSYTGEDIVEISAHGNPLVLGRIVETVRLSGARMAGPGEFTLRAVAHGKMDLIQAEAVREFIEAQTEQQARTALRQMEGTLSNRIRPSKEMLLDVIARMEAGIDFGEDDVDVPDNMTIRDSVRHVSETLTELQATFGYGKMLAHGLKVTILGKPNVGKSSLFNRLVAADRAIVTEIPGTTRDVLTETMSLDGVPLRFADTAGVRPTADVVERLGVERTLGMVSEADLVLVVVDGSKDLDGDDQDVLERAQKIPHILVINKRDLPQVAAANILNGACRVHVSARTGEGMDGLRETIRAFLLEQKSDLADDLVLTSARQHEAIRRGADHLAVAVTALERNVPHEMVLLDLYQALGALDELTGEVVTEDILGRIFSTFCIGK